jgi:hypothetical protein
VADTVADPGRVYAPVLEHLLATPPAAGAVPVVLHSAVYPGVSGSGNRTHPARVLRSLLATGKIQVVCDRAAGPSGCPLPAGEHVSVSLGDVIDLPDAPRVKVLPEAGTPGVPLDQALAAIPDSLAVPVRAAVDAVLRTPCPAAPGSERCRVPDIVIYRYFLDRCPDGTYRVVTRWLSGGA